MTKVDGGLNKNDLHRVFSLFTYRKEKELMGIFSIALMDALKNALGLNNLTVPISKTLVEKGNESQLTPLQHKPKVDTALRTWISLCLTAAGVTKNTLITCSTTSEFLKKLNTLPKNMVLATVMKAPQTMLYFEMLGSFRGAADHMGIPPNIGVPAATALTCTLLNPLTTAQMELSSQLSNGRRLATLPENLMRDVLNNPKRYVTAGLLPTIVRSAALEMVIEAAQKHLGLPKEQAIQLSYLVAFPLAMGADFSRLRLPISVETMKRPPVAIGTGGMAAAIVVAPHLAASIERLINQLFIQ